MITSAFVSMALTNAVIGKSVDPVACGAGAAVTPHSVLTLREALAGCLLITLIDVWNSSSFSDGKITKVFNDYI